MDFIGTQDFSVARLYLGFFVASFVILLAILLAALPSFCRAVVKSLQLFRARRERSFRMVTDLSAFDSAGRCLEGVTLFIEEGAEADLTQEDDAAVTSRISDAA